MRLIVQRVTKAEVVVKGTKQEVAKIGKGFLVLLGVKEGDSEKESDFFAEKLVKLRIMSDENDKINLSIKDTGGEILVVSQFTLYADTTAGNRPSFIKAANPQLAEKLYEKFVEKIREFNIPVQTGKFGEYMEVSLVNDGPVTIILES